MRRPRHALTVLGAVAVLTGLVVLDRAWAPDDLLPALTGIDAWLTPVAAAALALVMLFALIFHVVRGEMNRLASSVVLGILAVFAAYGRFVLAPF